MNKYQEYYFSLYSDLHYDLFKCQVANSEEPKEKHKYEVFDTNLDTLTIIQDEDITKTQYLLKICGYVPFDYNLVVVISDVEILQNSKWKKIKSENNIYSTIIDFDKKAEKIKFSFFNNLADDYIIDIKYQEADKEKYYAKKEEERKETLLKNAQIKHSTGAGLVNIYYQPCNENCVKTEIELWIAKGIREQHHGMLAYTPRLIGGEPIQLIAKLQTVEGIYFKSIDGLANGVYGYKIRQYDKDNNILIESDFNYFAISTSNHPIGKINR